MLRAHPTRREVEGQRSAWVTALVWCWVCLTTLLMRPVRQPARLALTNNAQPPLDSDPGCSSDPLPRRSRTRFSFDVARMLADWRWVWTELGTALMVLSVAESGWAMFTGSYQRAIHLHHLLGVSRGLALVFIAAILLAQLTSCVTLMVPTIYLTTGTIAPGAALVGTLWFEALLFGDMADTAHVVRCACLTATAVMLALFRFDRQARNAAAQLPTSGALLAAESRIRRTCTSLRTGVLFPPVALVTLLLAVHKNPFWSAKGILFEWYHGRFQMAVGFAALMLLLAGQDTRAHVVVGERLERIYDWCMKHKEDVLGQPRAARWLGAKKAL